MAPKAASTRKPRNQGGRPTTYSKELTEDICQRMALGETLTDILKAPGMPSETAVYEWRKAQPEFAEAFARAREDQMQAWSDQIISLADEASSDYRIEAEAEISADGTVKAKFDRRHVDRAKLMIDTRKWLMAKILPAVFGDRQTVDVNHNFADKDDAELMHDLRKAAESSGMTLEELAAVMNGQGVQ